MTDKQSREELDELVAQTYRELDAPRTPEHLNERVLRLAASESGPRSNLLFAAWMKPVGWAASIGLSLAIVMQLSELSTSPVPKEPTIAADSVEIRNEPAVLLQELSLQDVTRLKGEGKGKIESFAVSAPAASARSTDVCDARARQVARDWLQCIDDLRASGANEQADREYAAFILEHPAAAVDSERNK